MKSGGMWIFDNEVASIMGSFVNGDIVLVHDLTDILWEEDSSIRIPGLWYVFFQEMRIL